MYPFEYEVEYFEDKNEIAHGVLFAEDYTKAMEKLESYYDIINVTMLFALDESDVYEFENTHNEFTRGKYGISFFKW